MGLFSNGCSNPECKQSVPKLAQFCRACGSPAPDADTNCGRCGAVVSTSSTFCWKCGGNLSEMQKTPLIDNQWKRGENDFAIRIEECDVTGWLRKQIILEHGTKAVVFQKGRLVGTLDAGTYDMNGFLKRLDTFNQSSPASVVLYDAGDVQLHTALDKLRTKDGLDVDIAFKVVIHLSDPDAFYVNTLKSRNCMTRDYIGASLAEEVRTAVQSWITTQTVAELFGNPSLRSHLEKELVERIAPVLQRIGIELVQVRFVDLFCVAYDPIRKKQGEYSVEAMEGEVDIDRLKLAQKMRKNLADDDMHKIRTKEDVENAIRQAAHELNLKGVLRDDELDRLKRQFDQKKDMDTVTHLIEIEGLKNEARREEKLKDLDVAFEVDALRQDHRRDQKEKDAAVDMTLRQSEHEQDIKEAFDAISLRERTQRVEIDRQEEQIRLEAQQLKNRSEASAQALLSILDDEQGDKILALEKLRMQQHMSPEQIVALTAADSPELANALAEKYKAQAAMDDQRFEELKAFVTQQAQQSDASADRLERVMQVALQQMGQTASSRAETPGYSGKSCPQCSKVTTVESRFCQSCGSKV